MTVDSSSKPEITDREPETAEFVTSSAEQTFALARRIGEQLKGGEVFLLSGDLGAGKTIFAKGLAAALEIDPAEVTSPTFTLINSYEGRLRFVHIDLYRLDSEAHYTLGLDELLYDPKAVTAIEWAERLNFAPEQARVVNISYVSVRERRITISQ